MNGRGAMHSRNGPPVGAGAPAKTADPSAGDRLPALMMAGEEGKEHGNSPRNLRRIFSCVSDYAVYPLAGHAADGGTHARTARRGAGHSRNGRRRGRPSGIASRR